jgi:hypothetical protein
MTKLHLGMDYNRPRTFDGELLDQFQSQRWDPNDVQMRCIKSLKGFTQLSVNVDFEYRGPPGFAFEGLTEDQFCIRWYRTAILDFSSTAFAESQCSHL